MSFFDSIHGILTSFNSVSGTIPNALSVKRKLSDMRGYFVDEKAYQEYLTREDPLLYTVDAIEPAQGEGQLHYGIGMIAPGRVGDEYFMTKGHYHAWREAAEFYIGLQGTGVMLLEHEQTGETRMVPLTPNAVVYVPGYTAHRTINTGNAPLTYLGIYPALAGHDYGAIAERNFNHVVVERNGEPTLIDRVTYLDSLR